MLDKTPDNTTMNVNNFAGACLTNSFSTVAIKPERSAMPSPSMATNTGPTGAKCVKFVTILPKIWCKPVTLNKFTTLTVSPLTGCNADQLKDSPNHDTKITNAHK